MIMIEKFTYSKGYLRDDKIPAFVSTYTNKKQGELEFDEDDRQQQQQQNSSRIQNTSKAQQSIRSSNVSTSNNQNQRRLDQEMSPNQEKPNQRMYDRNKNQVSTPSQKIQKKNYVTAQKGRINLEADSANASKDETF